MARRVYRKDQHFENKTLAMSRFVAAFGYTYVEHSDLRVLRERVWDFAVYDSEEVGASRLFLARVLNRNIVWGQYPTIDISAKKFTQLVDVGVVLIVHSLKDHEVHYCRPGRVRNASLRVGGREDRDDPLDIEGMMAIPIGEFRNLAEDESPDLFEVAARRAGPR